MVCATSSIPGCFCGPLPLILDEASDFGVPPRLAADSVVLVSMCLLETFVVSLDNGGDGLLVSLVSTFYFSTCLPAGFADFYFNKSESPYTGDFGGRKNLLSIGLCCNSRKASMDLRSSAISFVAPIVKARTASGVLLSAALW